MNLAVIVAILFFTAGVLALYWVGSRHHDHDWAEKYQADLLLVKHWEDCQASEEGCHWPENCTFGDCRKVPDFTNDTEDD